MFPVLVHGQRVPRLGPLSAKVALDSARPDVVGLHVVGEVAPEAVALAAAAALEHAARRVAEDEAGDHGVELVC